MVVEVKPNDPINVLLNKLNISNKDTIFTFNGATYKMASNQTFEEIGLHDDGMIVVNDRLLLG